MQGLGLFIDLYFHEFLNNYTKQQCTFNFKIQVQKMHNCQVIFWNNDHLTIKVQSAISNSVCDAHIFFKLHDDSILPYSMKMHSLQQWSGVFSWILNRYEISLIHWIHNFMKKTKFQILNSVLHLIRSLYPFICHQQHFDSLNKLFSF